jgi:hypothetical protein
MENLRMHCKPEAPTEFVKNLVAQKGAPGRKSGAKKQSANGNSGVRLGQDPNAHHAVEIVARSKRRNGKRVPYVPPQQLDDDLSDWWDW